MIIFLSPIYEYRESHPSDTYDTTGELSLFLSGYLLLKKEKTVLIPLSKDLITQIKLSQFRDRANKKKLEFGDKNSFPLDDIHYLHFQSANRGDPYRSGVEIQLTTLHKEYGYHDPIISIFVEENDFIIFLSLLCEAAYDRK